VPEFVLRAWKPDGTTDLSMRVVVGQAYNHQTPIFADEMKYVVFRPYWNVPPNIQRAEIIPKLEGNRSYLANNGYEIVNANDQLVGTKVDDAALARIRSGDYRVRQKPGPSNALGLVKFMFPNENNVYLHSTPAQTLFGRSRRDFSHGCIRVQDPVALAKFVLQDEPAWTGERIQAAMEKGVSSTIALEKPLPVVIAYSTVIAKGGAVYFYPDLYGHDALLDKALAQRTSGAK